MARVLWAMSFGKLEGSPAVGWPKNCTTLPVFWPNSFFTRDPEDFVGSLVSFERFEGDKLT